LSSTGHQQAVAVNRLLDSMAASRPELARALPDLANCQNQDAALATLRRVVGERRQQLTRAHALKIGALPNGARMRASLSQAVAYSLRADEYYYRWGQAVQNCKRKAKPNADRQRGNVSSVRATTAKRAFIGFWTPVARKEHLPARTANGI
jgi:hypothetical protein